MKITIDTKEDSKEDITKVIELLHKFLSVTNVETENYNNFDSGEPVFGNLFDQPLEVEKKEEEEKEEKTFSMNELMTY